MEEQTTRQTVGGKSVRENLDDPSEMQSMDGKPTTIEYQKSVPSTIGNKSAASTLEKQKSLHKLEAKFSTEDSLSFTDILKGDIRSSKNTIQSKPSVTGSKLKSITSALKSLNENSDVDSDMRKTKLYLQKQGVHNMSIWSHLTNVLNKIIAEQPDNVIDYFEEYSRKVKQEELMQEDTLKEIYVPLPHLEFAKNQLLLLNSYEMREDAEEPVVGEENEEKESPSQVDLEEAAFYFREAGISIPDNQLFSINIAIKKMTDENNLLKPRFWGKVFGTKQDYFIFECELSDEQYEKRIEMEEAEQLAAEEEQLKQEQEEEEQVVEEQIQEEEQVQEEEEIQRKSTMRSQPRESQVGEEKESLKSGEKHENINLEEEGSKISFQETAEGEEGTQEEEQEDPLLPPLPPPKRLLTYKIPPILKPVLKETIKIPAEKVGEGLNRKIYFVCNTPELEWKELPKVTPEQINSAQQIKVYFTGDLDSQIITYPAFPGNEMNYLRAQIARISASTQISPIGFYKFPGGGEEEEEEEVAEEEEGGGDQKTIEENKKFEPIPVKDLLDPSFSSWVHHSRYILKQGRADWWNSKKAEAGEEEAEEEQEEEEDEEKEEGEEKEKGPPLLTPLSEDAPIEGLPAWVARQTRNYNPHLAGAVVKSNLWPGACAIAVSKRCQNIYCGWGHKHSPNGFSPAGLPHPEYEYDLGPEVLEIQDPTVEVEQAWREAHKKKPPPAEGEGEGEEGEEEEEEEEEDD